nr:ABC-three component system middle component 6 [uncultured Methanoregula sp.]
MILPDKSITLANSLVGLGYTIINNLQNQETISSLWEKTRKSNPALSYEKFILSLDLLYTLDLIILEKGLLKKKEDEDK